MKLSEEIEIFKSDKPKRLKVQFLAHKAEIIEALGQGHTRMEIWEVLKHKGAFTGNYSSLCFYVSTQINNLPPKTLTSKVMPVQRKLKNRQSKKINLTGLLTTIQKN